MIKVIISFLLGMFIGGTMGFLCACLVAANGDDDA